jgi:hypothetical protein
MTLFSSFYVLNIMKFPNLHIYVSEEFRNLEDVMSILDCLYLWRMGAGQGGRDRGRAEGWGLLTFVMFFIYHR